MRASEVMSHPPVTVEPGTLLKDAARLMAERHVSGLPVVEDGRLVGMITEGDLLRLEIGTEPSTQMTMLPHRAPRRVGDVMTAEVISVAEDTDLGVCVQRMLGAGVKRVPVVRGGAVVGIISRHDVMRIVALPDEQIRADVEAALRAEQGMDGIRVTVSDGVVVLIGRADPVAARLAESIARRVPGALAVRVSQT